MAIISDDIFRAQHLDEDTLRVEVATVFYHRELLSPGLAACMAELGRM